MADHHQQFMARVIFMLFVIALTAAAQIPTAGGIVIQGTASSNKVPIPGAVLVATRNGSQERTATSTDVNGHYSIRLPAYGSYTLLAEMTGFALVSRDFEVVAGAKAVTVDIEMTLQVRERVPTRAGSENASAEPPQEELTTTPDLDASRSLVSSDLAVAGMSSDSPTESVAVSGNTASPAFGGMFDSQRLAQFGGFDGFGPGGPGGLAGGPPAGGLAGGDEAGPRGGRGGTGGPGGPGGRFGGAGGPGGPGGGRGGPGGGQGGFGGRRGGGGGGGGGGGDFVLAGQRGRGNVNRLNINLGYTLADSVFDAAPYSINGADTKKSSYVQNRFNATVGGPLQIPHLLSGQRNNFTVTYNGARVRTPYDEFSTVPTIAERAGDFSQTLANNGSAVQLLDPQTRLPFANNQIPASRIDSAAAGLLPFLPAPNLPGSTQNFHYVTSNKNDNDDLNVRLSHIFGAAGQGGQRGNFPGGGFGGGGRGGGRGGRGKSISGGIQYRSQNNVANNPYPTIGGTTSSSGLNIPIIYSQTIGPVAATLRFNYNRSRNTATSLFSFRQNIEGMLGIQGVSQDPFDWGVPGLSFTNYSTLNDQSASSRENRSYQTGGALLWSHRRHSVSAGGDFSRNALDTHVSSNARGRFTFTGASTGYDFADFLLGLPQLTSVQYGSSNFRFRANSWDFFIQDNWRVHGNLTISAGLRYEYTSPFTEVDNRIVNLDAAPDFSAVAPVQPGETGRFTGAFPSSLVDPDRNNWAPRVGIAWRVWRNTIIRSGYGINYNNSTYNSMVQQFAFQPPFSVTQTNSASADRILTLQNGFPAPPPATVTNNFGVARDYRIGYAQVWNLNVQRQLPARLMMSLDYSGTKGAALNLLQAPNRTATGLRIPTAQAFTWQTSTGNSIAHAGSVQLRRRLQAGVAVGGTYTWSKIIDDVPGGGLGSTGMAQDAFNLAAERAVANNDQTQRFTGDYLIELPFGANKPWLSGDNILSALLGEWQLNGSWSIASGMPFTARVLGSTSEIRAGTNGTLRADATGALVALSDPVVAAWFNRAAFAVPAPGTFGNAGRNTIRGPGSKNLDMSLNKTVRFRDGRALDIRLQANNVLNIVQFRSIDTTVNSSSFGKVIAAGPMRRVQINLRYRF